MARMKNPDNLELQNITGDRILLISNICTFRSKFEIVAQVRDVVHGPLVNFT